MNHSGQLEATEDGEEEQGLALGTGPPMSLCYMVRTVYWASAVGYQVLTLGERREAKQTATPMDSLFPAAATCSWSHGHRVAVEVPELPQEIHPYQTPTTRPHHLQKEKRMPV